MTDNKKYILYTDIHKLVASTAAKVKEFNPDFMVRKLLEPCQTCLNNKNNISFPSFFGF